MARQRSRSPVAVPQAIVAPGTHRLDRCAQREKAFPGGRRFVASTVFRLANGPRTRISVASLSTTFCSVRTGYSRESDSCRSYRLGTVPSSDNRPAGHQPPCPIPIAMATSRAARSTPVCPPETMQLGTNVESELEVDFVTSPRRWASQKIQPYGLASHPDSA